MRYVLQISYNGAKYHGWQIQKNAVTVQEVVNHCLSLKLNEPIETIGCGRTDTGVHARNFFLHFDTNEKITKDFLRRLNSFLPKDILVKKIYKADDNFHTRFDAVSRTYKYFLTIEKDPMRLGYAASVWQPLDVEAMNNAAGFFLQSEDFTAFSKISKDEEHHLCTITYAAWSREENMIIFEIKANRFLRGMVRIITGTLIEVGKGKIKPDEVRLMIESKDRSRVSGAASAEGLFLWDVEYAVSLKEL